MYSTLCVCVYIMCVYVYRIIIEYIIATVQKVCMEIVLVNHTLYTWQ